ncbi:Toxoplasma gondii family A protein [Toxoplasma gondii p89]|uniref:Toxoplasma gondii family A protein n=1 Tax=Toxoplasma gondii p89 TaxID=943119 RepID=A0A086JIZ8_TOXGO|nr:Toxoplasma gondii family A protein [Toxoplasma gondii p89]
MARRIFRGGCSVLFIGTVLQCVAAESGQPTAEVDFSTIIPKGGLEGDVEEVFSLGSSGTIRVTDETASAVYQPEISENSSGTLTDAYSAAYRYMNGACDFTKTIQFKDVFPRYTAKLWTREESESGERGRDAAGKVVMYTFKTPPAEYLSVGLSFCMRFKTVSAAGSDSQTTVSTPSIPSSSESADHTNSGEADGGDDDRDDAESIPSDEKPTPPTAPEVPGNPVTKPENGLDENQVSPPGQHSPVPPQVNPIVPQAPDSGTQPQEHQDVVSRPGGGTQNDNVPVHPSDPPTEDSGQQQPPSNKVEEQVANDLEEGRGASLRRLDGAAAVNEAYLTIVVHSAAWNSARGVGTVLGPLLIVATTLLHIY